MSVTKCPLQNFQCEFTAVTVGRYGRYPVNMLPPNVVYFENEKYSDAAAALHTDAVPNSGISAPHEARVQPNSLLAPLYAPRPAPKPSQLSSQVFVRATPHAPT